MYVYQSCHSQAPLYVREAARQSPHVLGKQKETRMCAICADVEPQQRAAPCPQSYQEVMTHPGEAQDHAHACIWPKSMAIFATSTVARLMQLCSMATETANHRGSRSETPRFPVFDPRTEPQRCTGPLSAFIILSSLGYKASDSCTEPQRCTGPLSAFIILSSLGYKASDSCTEPQRCIEPLSAINRQSRPQGQQAGTEYHTHFRRYVYLGTLMNAATSATQPQAFHFADSALGSDAAALSAFSLALVPLMLVLLYCFS
eukprot:1159955-Pelagomonas_calceolata.AAC.9